MTTLTHPSPQAAFEAAVAAVESQDVTVHLNVMTCCRSCTDFGDLTNYVWTFGGQNLELVWDHRGRPQHREVLVNDCQCEDEEVDDDGTVVVEAYECEVCSGHTEEEEERLIAAALVYFYFDTTSAAATLRDAMLANGLTAEWDQNPMHAVTVTF